MRHIELLESRSLPTGLALIAGTVFDDLTGDGLSADDPGIAAVTVSLSRDGGNGLFDAGAASGDDVLIDTQATDAQGRYEFEFLSGGRYFIEQAAVAGRLQHPAANFATVDIAAVEAFGVPYLLVDDFSATTQTTTANTITRTNSSSVAATEAIGGERDFFLELTSDEGTLSLESDSVASDMLEFTANPSAIGRRVVIWDGVDGDGATLDATGLGGIDLTGAGTSRYFLFLGGADIDNGELLVRVYSDADNWSLGRVDIPNIRTAAPALVTLSFSDFIAQAGGGADFTNVGAIEMETPGGKAVDGLIDEFRSFAPVIKTADFATFQPLSLGDAVWLDADDDGQFDATEQPISGVAVDLFEDTDDSGDFTSGTDTLLDSTTTNSNGLYLFDALFPSSYVVRISESNFNAGAALRGFLSSTGNTPTPDPDDNVNNDDNGDALAGQGVVSRAITLTATAEPTTDGDLDANTNLSVDFGFFPVADLMLDKADDVDPVVAGELLTYTLTISNLGESAATGVTVTDPLPSGVTFVSASSSQGSVSQSNGTVTATLGGLAEGGAATVTINVRVAPGTRGTISNTATVSANETDLVIANNTDTEPTLVIARADLEIVKTDDVDPVTAGEFLTYTLTVTNHGPSNATGVTVTDPLPANTTFDAATTSQGTATVSNGTLTANLGNLALNASATISVRVRVVSGASGSLNNTANVTGTEPDPVSANNSDTEPTVIVSRTDLSIVKSDDVDPVTAGNLLTYTLLVTNNGPSDATGVAVSDPIPVGTSFVSATTTQGSVGVSNGTLTSSIGNLANTAGATITVTVRVNSSTTTSLNNTATVIGDQPDPISTNNSDSEPTAVVISADLEVLKTDSSDPVVAGELLTYTLLVTNHGPSDATGVSVSDPLPAGATFVLATTTQGSVSVSNGIVSVAVGNLIDDATATILVTVRVAASQTTELSNTATVTADPPDPFPPNNISRKITGVVPRTDLAIMKSDNVDPVTAGQSLIYTLVITNHGPSNATGVSVNDPIPAGTTFMSATTTQGTVSVVNGVLTASVGNLANNASATVTVTVRVNSSTTGSLNNTATVTGNQPDPVPGNNSDSEPTAVVISADLEVLKTDSSDPVVAGELLTYTLLVTNHGPSDATGVSVSDPLPTGTTFVSATATQGSVSVSNGVVSAAVGNLLDDATATILVTVRVAASQRTDLSNTATVTANPPDPVPPNNISRKITRVTPRIDLEIRKSDDADPVIAGQSLTYTLLVLNLGPSNATGVTVIDTLPAGVTFVSATTTQGTVSAANGIVTTNLSGLADDATATVTITVTVNSSTTGTIINTASVSGNEVELNLANNQDSEPTTVVSQIDLGITKTVSASPVEFGVPFSYTLLVMNNGPSDATGVTVVDALPTGLTIDLVTTTRGTASSSNGTITANIGNLARSATATLIVMVRSTGVTVGSITNIATVSGRETETTLTNNTAQATTFLEPQRASLSGSVYVDANNDGQFASGEIPIAGVTVRLIGTDIFGNAVSLTRQTATNGLFLFANLRPGTYRLVETQPTNYRDGKDTPSSVLTATTTNDQFSDINLTAGTNGTAFNFGELSQQLSKKSFLASSTSPQTAGIPVPTPAPLRAAALVKKLVPAVKKK